MLIIARTTEELLNLRKKENKDIGFVPTMGNLHAGHISLLDQALNDFDTAYFSIFVNPKQFGPNEDFNRYPRTLEQDISQIESLLTQYPQKTVVVYAPQNPEEVFPTNERQTVSVTNLSEKIEGKIRPGHFDGVTTVVYRLFDLVKPKRAYFGLKDYQQYVIIKQMAKDLNLPTEIIGMPIVREKSGLAMSSRNQYLTEEQKEEARILYRTLKKIEEILGKSPRNIQQAQDYINKVLFDPNWNYLLIVDAENLSEDISASKKVSILGVYQLGKTRLLDNLQVEFI